MTTTRMTRQWDRWAGTIQDIERATRLAAEVLAQRTRTEPPCHIEIALPGRVTHADTPQALETEIDTRDLSLIRSIRIEIGSKRGLRATIHLERQQPAGTVEVSGDDRTRVEGLISQLGDLLGRGKQRLGVIGTNVLIVGSIVTVVLLWVSVTAPLDRKGPTPPLVAVALVALLILAVVGVGYGGSWLLPSLELLVPGAQARLRRFRLAVIAFASSVFASVAAALIYEASK
jgi:hypothetical protein